MILLINKNDDARLMPYDQQYRLFNDWKTAITEAKKIGWQDPLGMGINHKIGTANIYQCGEINLTLMAVKVE